MVIWNLTAITVNTISIFIVYYECAFQMKSAIVQGAVNYLIELILAAEVILIFFKAFPDRESPRGYICSLLGACGLCKQRCILKRKDREEKKKLDVKESFWNHRFKEVALRYFSSNFIIDFVSVYPFLLGKMTAGSADYDELINRGYMQVFGYLRLLRITQLPKILGASNIYAQLLMQKYPSKRQIINNVNQVLSLVIFLTLSLHLSACVNIFQGMANNSWINYDDDNQLLTTSTDGVPSTRSASDFYINQMYFMTTTMTTIGYGDLRAAKYPDYQSPDNMLMIFFLQFIAIFTFSLI